MCGQFVKLFKGFNKYLEAAKIQGFTWDKSTYTFGKGKAKSEVRLHLDENTYLILVLRYKELSSGDGGGGGTDDVPFEIDGYLTEIDTDVIDADYMNTRFDKYLKTLKQEGVDSEQIQKNVDELHKSFATLTQEEQKYANIFLNDVQRGDMTLEEGKTFREYITEYQSYAKNSQITAIVQQFALDEVEFNKKLNKLMNTGVTATNINEFGRFDDLKSGVDRAKAKAYFERLESASISPFTSHKKTDKLLQDFIIRGGFDLAEVK